MTGVVEQLHLLEQVSSSEHIGSMTEGLLKVLDKKEVVEKVILLTPSINTVLKFRVLVLRNVKFIN